MNLLTKKKLWHKAVLVAMSTALVPVAPVAQSIVYADSPVQGVRFASLKSAIKTTRI